MEKRSKEQNRVKAFGLFGQQLSAWAPSLSWMLLIFFLSSRHSIQVSPEYFLNFLFFKTLHVIEYAILYALNSRAGHIAFPKWSRNAVFRFGFILTILYAMTDEYHQLFVPSRTGRARDVIIDLLGMSLSWLVLQQLLPKAHVRLKNLARQLDFLF